MNSIILQCIDQPDIIKVITPGYDLEWSDIVCNHLLEYYDYYTGEPKTESIQRLEQAVSECDEYKFKELWEELKLEAKTGFRILER